VVAPRAGSVIEIADMREKLEQSRGGRQVGHMSPALEVGVEVFNSPGLGELRAEDRDVLYIVLDGSGVLGVENGDPLALVPGEAAPVPVGAIHVIFGNPRLSLLIVKTTSQRASSSPLTPCPPI
jgi:hypothetical protein